MASTPAISIIMSVYKPSRQELEISLKSVFLQTYQDYEIILIKDDAEIETLTILEEWKTKDSRINLIDNVTNQGLITSLNKGLDASKANLIARLDVGDWWENTKLAQQIERFRDDPKLFICGTGLTLVDEVHRFLAIHKAPETDREIKDHIFKSKNPFAHPSVMFRKTVLRYNPSALYCEDYELWCRYSLLGTMLNINEPLTNYVIDTSGITNSKRSLMIENVTKAYCAFLKKISTQNSHSTENLQISPTRQLTQLQILSNRFYSFYFINKLQKKWWNAFFNLLMSLFFNPALITNKLKRIFCKFIYRRSL